jgi:hypothetical protein
MCHGKQPYERQRLTSLSTHSSHIHADYEKNCFCWLSVVGRWGNSQFVAWLPAYQMHTDGHTDAPTCSTSTSRCLLTGRLLGRVGPFLDYMHTYAQATGQQLNLGDVELLRVGEALGQRDGASKIAARGYARVRAGLPKLAFGWSGT